MSGDNSWRGEDLRRPAGDSPPQQVAGPSSGSSSQPHGLYSSSYDAEPSASSSTWESVRPTNKPPKQRRPPTERPRSVSSASTTVTSSAKSEAQKDRVPMACLHCRARKVRCDGGQPRCGLCSRLNRSCSYARVTEAENLVLRTRKRELKARRHNRETSSASNSSHPPRANSEGEEGWSSMPSSLSGLPGPSPTTSRPRASTGGNPELTYRVPGHHIGCYCERCHVMRSASGYSTSSGTNTTSTSSSSHGSPSQVIASSTGYVGVPGWMSPPSGGPRPSSAGLAQPSEPPPYAGPAGGSLGLPSNPPAWHNPGAEGVGPSTLPIASPSALANKYGYEAPHRERAYTTSAFQPSPAHDLQAPSSFSTSPTNAWSAHQHAVTAQTGRARSSSSNVVPAVLRSAPVQIPSPDTSMYDAHRRPLAVSPKPPQESFHDPRVQHASGSMLPPDHWSSYARSQEPVRREVTDQLADATSHVSLERAAIESQFGSMATPTPAQTRTFAPAPVYPPGSHVPIWQGQGSSLSPHSQTGPLPHEAGGREDVGSSFFQAPAPVIAEPQGWQLYSGVPAPPPAPDAARYRPSSYHAEDRYDDDEPYQQPVPHPQSQHHDHDHDHQQHHHHQQQHHQH